MSWNELQLNIPSLEVDIVDKVYENIVVLKDKLEEMGYPSISVTNPNASYDVQIRNVINVLQTVENDLDALNNYKESVYWGEPKIISKWFTENSYRRWVRILNDIYDMTFGQKTDWAILELSDCIPTIDGLDIAIRR